MGIRKTSDSRSTPGSELRGSLFDSRQRPTLPRGLPKDVKAIVNDLLDNNPHLWANDQMPALVRLAKIRVHFDVIWAQINVSGQTVFDEKKGIEVVNPMVETMMKLSSNALQLERALCISFITREVQVKKAEREAPPNAGKPNRKAGPPQLRLA